MLETPPRALLDTFPSLDSSKGRTVIDHSHALVARAEQPLSFTFAETGDTIDAIAVNGEPWFIAAPIARFLSYRDADKLLRNLDDDEKGTHTVGTPGDQRVSIVSLPGLLRALATRRAGAVKDEAVRAMLVRFQRWVFHDVLPQILLEGPSAPMPRPDRFPVPQTFADALELAARQARELEAAEAQLAIAAPKADAFDTYLATDQDPDILRIVAKALGMPEKTLRRTLLDAGLIFWSRTSTACGRAEYEPYAQYGPTGTGLFAVKRTTVTHTWGECVHQTVTVTPKGVEYIRRLLATTQEGEGA